MTIPTVTKVRVQVKKGRVKPFLADARGLHIAPVEDVRDCYILSGDADRIYVLLRGHPCVKEWRAA